MIPDQTITLHENTPLQFRADIYRVDIDGDATYRIITRDDPDDAEGFNADWNPDTHVFRIWHYNSVDHVSDKKPASLEEAVEQLRLYLSD